MFTGKEDQQIDLTTASDLTAQYRADMSAGKYSIDPTLGHYFSRSCLETILAQESCVGVRVYYGQTGDGSKELVMVGVEENEDDLYEGFIGDRSYKSPPQSGSSNPLNC